ncbi:hypothetical protein [Litorihabitans aurantiacus]|nr:hypothetical protein [Litorihabitans aurantiacus]
MPATSAFWAVCLAVLLAAGLLVAMILARRPEAGYRTWLRETMRPLEGGDASAARPGRDRLSGGAVTEMRDAAEGEVVGLSDLLREGEPDHGYLTVPQRYEDRFEELTVAIGARQRALADRRGAYGRGDA